MPGCGCGGASSAGSAVQQKPPAKKKKSGRRKSIDQTSTTASSDPQMTRKIKSFLEQHHSPMAPYAADIVKSGKKHNVDPRLIVAISGQESSFGNKLFRPYNAWGWMSGENFTSWPQSIERIARGLDEGYTGQGLKSVSAIQRKWAPEGASNDPTNLNSGWTTGVSTFYRELGGNPSNVTA